MTLTGDTLAAAAATAIAGPTTLRTCIGCRARHAQSRLLRFRRRGDGHVVPAVVTRDLSGRTAYLCPRRSCLDQAIKRRAFARAFSCGRRRPSVVDIDPDALWAATLDQLRCEIDLLGRSAENPHAHLRRRGLEQLLFELSSQPKPPERSASKRGLTQSEVPMTQAETHENSVSDEHTRKGGDPSHG